jgi:dienelactone hydrolase
VGAIGMCLTGNFAINLMLEDVVLAPVASQPSLPLKPLGGPSDALGLSPETLRAAVARSSDVPLLCYRFEGDRISRREPFKRLAREFGGAFEGHELPGRDHSVLTIDFVDKPDHPTFQARERVMRFFDERLKGG